MIIPGVEDIHANDVPGTFREVPRVGSHGLLYLVYVFEERRINLIKNITIERYYQCPVQGESLHGLLYLRGTRAPAGHAISGPVAATPRSAAVLAGHVGAHGEDGELKVVRDDDADLEEEEEKQKH